MCLRKEGKKMTEQNCTYQAKVNFYHEAVGTVSQGQAVEISDKETAQKLEQMGYVQKVDAQAHSAMAKAQQEQQAKQQEYGQAQAKANEQAGVAAHEQNVQANQATQEFNMARQQQAMNQQANAQAQTQADKALVHDQSQAFQPSATTNADTKAQVTQAKAARMKATEQHENK
jgi:hypothetical protein